MRSLLGFLNDLADAVCEALFGPRCRRGCGQRVYPRDIPKHEALDHAGDRS